MQSITDTHPECPPVLTTTSRKSRRNAKTFARAKARRRREKKHRDAKGLGSPKVEQGTTPPEVSPDPELKPLEYFLDPDRILTTVRTRGLFGQLKTKFKGPAFGDCRLTDEVIDTESIKRDIACHHPKPLVFYD